MSMTRLEKLEKAIQDFIDDKDESGDGSSGLVTDYFLGIGYTRIYDDGDQPFSRTYVVSRTYVASANPYGGYGVGKLCLSDAKNDLGAGCQVEDE